MEKNEFVVYYIIHLIVVLVKDIIMFTFNMDVWIIVLTSLIFGIIYWSIIFKRDWDCV